MVKGVSPNHLVVDGAPRGGLIVRSLVGQERISDAWRFDVTLIVDIHAIDDTARYELRLVPRLGLLKRRTRRRTSQNMRVPEIVTAVLAESAIATRWHPLSSWFAFPIRCRAGRCRVV